MELDQDRFNSRDNRTGSFLAAREAAALLGVKPATFYTYVSRGDVRRVPAPAGSAGPRKLYLRADVERLKARAEARTGHRAVAEGALRWGQPVLDTEITLVAGGELFWRGRPFDDLVERGLDVAAALLWQRDHVKLGLAPLEIGGPAASDRAPLVRMQAAVLALAAADPLRGLVSADDDRARACRIVGAIASSAVAPRRPSAGGQRVTLERALANAWGLPPAAAAPLGVALVASADHGLNASTTACRVAASTGADLYACILAGLATLTGPKHGGACDRVDAFLDEALATGEAAAAVERRAARGEAPPGLGHPLYPSGDPRAEALLSAARAWPAVDGGASAQAMMLGLADEAQRLGLPAPTLDFGLVALARTVGLPAGAAAALFAVGRSVGWVAHALEQRAQGHLIRPRARYVGPPPVPERST